MLIHEKMYQQAELMAAGAIADLAVQAAQKAPLILASTLMQSVILFFVVLLEMHIVYMFFDYISDGGNETWSPEIMSLTGAVMILGFHTLAAMNPDNFSVRFVNKAAQYSIPLYLLGLGLIIAGMLADGGLFDLLQSSGDFGFPEMENLSDTNWVETIITSISNPLAVLAFSFGLGGLAVVNIFVANNQLHKIKDGFSDRYERLQKAKVLKRDFQFVQDGIEKYSELGFDLAEFETHDDETIAETVGTEALSIIADELKGPKEILLNHELGDKPIKSDFLSNDLPDLKQLQNRINKIEALDLTTIKNIMLGIPKKEKRK